MTGIYSFEKIAFYLALAVFALGCLLRAYFMDFSDFDYGIYSDHFINAVSAKNISIGLDWSSSGYETYLLNPENLTIGPTIVLPVTAAIALFGNKLAVPGLTVLMLNLVLLVLVFRSLKQLHHHHISYYLCVFLLVFLFVFFKSYYWYRMIGEITAILLLLLLIIHLSHYLQTFSTRSFFATCIAGTFAMGTKELVLLPIVALAITIMFVSFCSRVCPNKGPSFWLGRPLLFLAACLSLPVLFFFYRNALLQTQTETWRSAYFAYANGIHNYYSGANTLHEYLLSPANALHIFLRVFNSTLWNGSTLLHHSFAGMRGLQYWLFVFGALFIFILRSGKFFTLHALLAISAIPLLLWFFCISEKAMPRHLYIGLCLAALANLLYSASIKNGILRYAVAAPLLLLIVFTGDQSSRFALISLPTKPSAHVAAVNDMQNYIEQQPEKSLAWMGMFYNNEFEFLSRVPNNFTSGFDLVADSIALNEPDYLASHPHVRALINGGQYHSAFDYYVSADNSSAESVAVDFIKPLDFNWLHFKTDIIRLYHSGVHLDKGELCKGVIYQNEYYVVERCVTDDIQAFFASRGGLPMRPRKWRPYILLPSERAELF